MSEDGRLHDQGHARPPDVDIDVATIRSEKRLATRWTATGRQRHVATWFGLAKIWIEEKRMVYRAMTATPSWWTEQVRWRRAGRRDRRTIAEVVTFDGPETTA